MFRAEINCSNNFMSSISSFNFPKDENFKREWLKRMKRKSFQTTKHLRVCTDHFTKTASETKSLGKKFVRFGFKALETSSQKDAVPTIFNFKMGVGQKRSHSNNHPCSQKSGTTLQGTELRICPFNVCKTRKIKEKNLPSCYKLDLA